MRMVFRRKFLMVNLFPHFKHIQIQTTKETNPL